MSLSIEYVISHVFPTVFEYDKKYDELTMNINDFNLYDYNISIREIFYKLYPLLIKKHTNLLEKFTMKQYEDFLINDKELEYLDEENINISDIFNVIEPTKNMPELKLQYTKFNKILFNDYQFIRLEKENDIKHFKIENLVYYNKNVLGEEGWNINYYLTFNLKTFDNIYTHNIEYILLDDFVLKYLKILNIEKVIYRYINNITFLKQIFHELLDINDDLLINNYHQNLINYCNNITIIPHIFVDGIIKTANRENIIDYMRISIENKICFDFSNYILQFKTSDALQNMYISWGNQYFYDKNIIMKIIDIKHFIQIINAFTVKERRFYAKFALKYLLKYYNQTDKSKDDIDYTFNVFTENLIRTFKDIKLNEKLFKYINIYNVFSDKVIFSSEFITFCIHNDLLKMLDNKILLSITNSIDFQYEIIRDCINLYSMKNIVEICNLLNINSKNICAYANDITYNMMNNTRRNYSIGMFYIIKFKEEPPLEFYHSPRYNINGNTLENVWRKYVCSDVPKEMLDIRFYNYMIENNGRKSPEHSTAVYTYFSNSEEMKIIFIDDKNLLLDPAKKRFVIEIDFESVKTFITEEIDTNDICLFGKISDKDWAKISNGHDKLDVVVFTDIKDIYRHRTPLKTLLEFLKTAINIKFDIKLE